jgi:ATP-dependent RNA helicase RhlB
MKFTELNLHSDLQRGIDDAGFIDCMPVQEMVFEHSLKGEDIYAQSQTGTGKTAAFLISILQRMMTDSSLRAKKTLVVAPTRELAVQIEAEAEKLGKYLDIKAGAFYGGVSYGPQIDMIRSGVQLIVGTPGRLIDLLRQGKMILKDVGFLVIDEADRMFDMGFIDDLRHLLRYLPPADQRQTYLFSATLGLRVKDLAWEYMSDPKEIAIEPEKVTVELVTQELYHVGTHEKLNLLLGLLDRERPGSCLIFCNQKFMVEELARRLKMNGVACEFIMGDLPQAKRLEVIERLKAGQIATLVATDVAARGLDIEALDLVINYDVPEDAESYVHRIGRTARAGKAGKAITLACEKFVYGLYAIEKYLGSKIPVLPITDQLLLADKSAGVRFSRERGGEGRGGRGGRDQVRRGGPRQGGHSVGRHEAPRRGGPERQGADRDGPAREAPRNEAVRREAAYRDQSRQDASRERGGQAPAPRRDRPSPDRRGGQRRDAPAGAARGGDPYAVSQDERMRRYKEKYGEAPEGRDQRGQSSKSSKGPQRGQGSNGPRQKSPEGARPQTPGGGDAQRKAPAAPAANIPKAGLLGRIKRLFGGGKD